eukprot:scpid96283/ scgid29619/ 
MSLSTVKAPLVVAVILLTAGLIPYGFCATKPMETTEPLPDWMGKYLLSLSSRRTKATQYLFVSSSMCFETNEQLTFRHAVSIQSTTNTHAPLALSLFVYEFP